MTNVSGFVAIVKGMRMVLMVVLRCFVMHAIFQTLKVIIVEGTAVGGDQDLLD